MTGGVISTIFRTLAVLALTAVAVGCVGFGANLMADLWSVG